MLCVHILDSVPSSELRNPHPLFAMAVITITEPKENYRGFH